MEILIIQTTIHFNLLHYNPIHISTSKVIDFHSKFNLHQHFLKLQLNPTNHQPPTKLYNGRFQHDLFHDPSTDPLRPWRLQRPCRFRLGWRFLLSRHDKLRSRWIQPRSWWWWWGRGWTRWLQLKPFYYSLSWHNLSRGVSGGATRSDEERSNLAHYTHGLTTHWSFLFCIRAINLLSRVVDGILFEIDKDLWAFISRRIALHRSSFFLWEVFSTDQHTTPRQASKIHNFLHFSNGVFGPSRRNTFAWIFTFERRETGLSLLFSRIAFQLSIYTALRRWDRKNEID